MSPCICNHALNLQMRKAKQTGLSHAACVGCLHVYLPHAHCSVTLCYFVCDSDGIWLDSH